MKYIIIAIASIALMSCTDAQKAQWTTIGNAGNIICYSGGHIIYQGRSTGKISTEHGSDGWFFKETGTDSLVRVSGDCVIKN